MMNDVLLFVQGALISPMYWSIAPPPAETASVYDRVAVCTGEDESVTLTVNVEDPAADGVPEITPVEAGSEPVDATKVYDAFPPVTLIVILNVWLTTPLPRDVVEIASGAGAAAPT